MLVFETITDVGRGPPPPLQPIWNTQANSYRAQTIVTQPHTPKHPLLLFLLINDSINVNNNSDDKNKSNQNVMTNKQKPASIL